MQRVNDSGRRVGRDREPAYQLAIDEAMLLWADTVTADDTVTAVDEDRQRAETNLDTELIRIWTFDRPVVVLGRSSRVADEVDRSFCEANEIPILRRSSGGASVVAGPGCLMYSIVLSFDEDPELQKIDVAHRHVMSRVLAATRRQLPESELQGICDLTWQNRKCSGNSLRVARRHLLYHGTILHDFDLDLLARCLAEAPRQPEYRGGRSHNSFVTNIAIDVAQFSEDLQDIFDATRVINASQWVGLIDQLRRERYDQSLWHFRH